MISDANLHTKLIRAAHPPRVSTPTGLDKPSFLMNFPFSYSADTANNAWMQDLSPQARRIDIKKARRQFLELYHFVASETLVCVLPTPAGGRLQDLVFTANLGIVLQHLPGDGTVVLSNHSTAPRVGETEPNVPW